MSSDEPAELEPNPKAEASDAAIDTGLVREIAEILKDTDLTEIEVERGDLRIRVARGGAAAVPVLAAPPTVLTHTVSAPSAAPAPAPADAAPIAPAATTRGDVVKSPMVGTVYLSAQPGAEPFVRPGDKISQGQTLLIIEAMKTMNPIPAPRAGVLLKLLVEDGQPVEFGEDLLAIE